MERHQALDLRCYPGFENWALFNLGSRKGEEYLITFEGCGADWDPRVYHHPNARNECEAVQELSDDKFALQDDAVLETGDLSRERLGEGIGSGDTIVTPIGSSWMSAVVNPPRDAIAGEFDIGILELSSGRNTTVEFKLNANAPGRGLYTF